MNQFPPGTFERLIESSPDIVIAVDRTGTVIFYNDGAEKILGYRAEEVRGQKVTLLYPSIDEARKVMAAMRSDRWGGPGKVTNYETTFVDRWGERIPVAISGSILYDEAGLELGSIGFAKDIREIRRRDQLATLGEVAVALCHEINSPLEVIVNEVALLEQFVRRAAPDDDAAVVEEERLDAIRREVEKIKQIVGRLVAMSQERDYRTREYLEGQQMTDITSSAAAPEERRSLAGLRILVADDDLGVCRSLQDLFAAEGCQVFVAGNGRDALELLDRVEVDIVISDVVMPDIDGYELFREVQKRGGTPVVLMTGYYYDRDHVIKRSRMEGLQSVIFKKPIDPARLKQVVAERCGRAPQAR